ncbi:energy transducer TonB [Sulfuricurvum sp.]|uniref:energy transducer TonB n=1 Tax=Sulfuricurvum sp. TaxID=2025608 RepID=UPI002603B7B6|nr:TonB family protein [Sulfuricurvum sp.]MDD2267757.1 TonB family protein [Sulfuricurvum sp.]MDD2783701.1 TonB family protein [Sulfuricurvum sp.]
MNTTSKAFGVSVAFHSLMALFALLILSVFHTPKAQTFALPIKHITIVSLSQPSKVVSPPTELAQPLKQTPIPVPQTPKPKMAEPLKPTPLAAIKPLAAAPQVQPVATPVSAAAVTAPVSESKPTISTAAVQSPAQSPAKPAPKADLSALKNSFFASLRSNIQHHLRYPSAARRRGMEGEVDVRFTLTDTGIIKNISIRQGESIFHEAAKLAVASASGVKVPEALSDSLPIEIDLTLEFTLNNG